jgi:hypothetical protein
VPRYFFNLNDGRRIIPDLEGTELPDDDSARVHGCHVVRELARNRERTTRSWRLAVCDDQGTPCFELPFASLDDPVSTVIFPLRISAQRMMPLRTADRRKEP